MRTMSLFYLLILFFFSDTATTEIYTLSLHDALPILQNPADVSPRGKGEHGRFHAGQVRAFTRYAGGPRSEEHTSELQSRRDLVCRLLLEKKNIDIQKLILSARGLT